MFISKTEKPAILCYPLCSHWEINVASPFILIFCACGLPKYSPVFIIFFYYSNALLIFVVPSRMIIKPPQAVLNVLIKKTVTFTKFVSICYLCFGNLIFYTHQKKHLNNSKLIIVGHHALVGHGGQVRQYNGPEVDTVIARRVEDSGRREARQVNPGVSLLHPSWVFSSCDQGKPCPTEDFEL